MNSSFCYDTFWNLNETWNVDVPDFSSCFQATVFVFIPSIIFSLAGVLNYYLLSKNGSFNSLPWAPRIILRFILCFILFIISTVWCVLLIYKTVTEGDVPISALTASVSRSLAYVIVITLMFKNRYHGVTTSTVLSFFWFCFAFTGIIMHRSIILKYNSKVSSFDLHFILSMIYYPLIYVQFILSFFVDIKSYDHLEVGSPFEEEAWISSITYVWFNRIVYRGIKRLLTIKDFLPLAVKLKSSFTYQNFSKYWKFHLTENDLKKQNLAWTLLKSFWPLFVIGFILQIMFNFLSLLLPLLLDGILEFVTDDRYSWKTYFFTFAIFLNSFLVKTLNNNCIMYFLCTCIQVKSSLISAVFRKNLMISSSARKNFPSGSISNLISVDINRISDFALYATNLISAPLKIILVLALMWQYLGPSSLSGIAVIAVLFPFSFYINRISERFIERQMTIKDARLKCMNEILQGIKILKFYAWEVPFSLKISKIRKEETKLIQFSQLCYVVSCFVIGCAPILVSIASFATFLLVNKKNVLDPTRAFVTLNLLEQLRYTLFIIPDALSELVQTITSIGRIEKFLTAEETELGVITGNPGPGNALSFTKATLHWSKGESVALENIDFEAPKGGFVAVIGPVGSGKSSLLSAILGDLHKSSGSVDVLGSLAYVPQEAWILNRSLKNNILLEKPMHPILYKRVLDCCCLKPDLEVLPGGDETEIGEKGINLSGGQKQRISLARAVFQNKDIYIMDDPLSAVDAHVRKSLIQDVIGNQGLLRNKTRILVTHDITVLEYVDFIIRMEAGKIVESGSYRELMANSETFLNFIKTHAGFAHEENALQDNQAISKTSAEGNIQKTYDRTISEETTSESKHHAANLIEDEKMEEGGVKRGIYLNYARHMGWPILILAFLGYVTFTSLEAGGNVWLADWSSDALHNGTRNEARTVWRLSVYGGLGVAQALTLMFGVACMVYGSTKAAKLYHSEMLASTLKSPLSFFDITPMGRIINRFSTDMDTLDIHIIYEIDGWLNCVLYSITIFVIIGINQPMFLAYVVPLGILYYIFLKLHLNTSRQIQRLESTTRSPIYSHLLESIYGVNSIKSFEVEKEFIENLEDKVDSHIACSFNIYACNRWLHFWLDLIGCTIVLIATLLAIENRQSLEASVIGLIITYALSVTDALMWIVRCNTTLENQSVAIERIDEYCRLNPEASWRKHNDDPAVTWPESGEIVFDNYSTRYRENLDLVLKDINLNIHANEKVGIVGRTGAGKSSVTLALFRIIEPAQGTILIDNVDVSKIGLHSLRSKLTIIPQDPVLFTGSLRFNLDPNDEYEDVDVWKSLENAHLKDFVSTLSDGLQFTIQEGGGNLSAGQKQLLCLSRALLRKSKILVLDEATAAVDMDTDSLVQDTIKTAFANHTVITIAHRLNTVMDYDKIVVMDNGEIVEVGRPVDLIQMQNSHFYSMARKAGLI